MKSKNVKNNLARHDALVEIINKEMVGRGWTTHKFTEYSKGEIDLYAFKDNTLALFEMKCGRTRKEYVYAHDQMARALDYCFKGVEKAHCFVVRYKSKKGDSYVVENVNPYNPKR